MNFKRTNTKLIRIQCGPSITVIDGTLVLEKKKINSDESGGIIEAALFSVKA
jgi:hypothetical protein